jgi:hypothetical protein
MDKLIRTAGGVSLIAAPVTLVVSELLYGATPEGHEAAWRLANVLGLLSAALFVPAVAVLAMLPGAGSGHRWAGTGAVLGSLGVAGYAAHTGMFVVIGELARQQGGDAVDDLVLGLDGSPAAGAVLLMFLVGLYLGLVLLMVGARRAHRVPTWATAAVVAAVVLASVPIVDALEYAAQVLVIVGLGGAGVAVLRGPGATRGRRASSGVQDLGPSPRRDVVARTRMR